MPQTIEDLGKKVKAKYPGQYDDLADADLGRKVKSKYPGDYDDFSDIAAERMSGVVSGSSTAGFIKNPSGSADDPNDPGVYNIPPNAELDLAKGFLGMPKDFAGVQQPSLKDALASTPLNPMFLVNQGVNAAKGMASSMINAPSNLANGDPYSIGQGLQGVATAVPIAKTLTGAIKGALPSASAAASKFQQANAVAKNVPLDTAAADDIALRAYELGGGPKTPGRGSSLPKIFKDYIKTREQSGARPMTYDVGRDFAKNAGRLSFKEAQKLGPAAKSEMTSLAAQFSKAMKSSTQDAATTAGVGKLHSEAMTEYARAMKAREAVRFGLKAALGVGAGGYAMKKLAE